MEKWRDKDESNLTKVVLIRLKSFVRTHIKGHYWRVIVGIDFRKVRNRKDKKKKRYFVIKKSSKGENEQSHRRFYTKTFASGRVKLVTQTICTIHRMDFKKRALLAH